MSETKGSRMLAASLREHPGVAFKDAADEIEAQADEIEAQADELARLARELAEYQSVTDAGAEHRKVVHLTAELAQERDKFKRCLGDLIAKDGDLAEARKLLAEARPYIRGRQIDFEIGNPDPWSRQWIDSIGATLARLDAFLAGSKT